MQTTPIRLLLVEDDYGIARLTRDYLERYGVSVHWVANGEDAIREGLSPEFDVVVLDLMLPLLDGLQVCRVVRERSAVPIIMVTARVDVADRVVGLELGADDYLTKPFSARELLARTHALVRRDRGQTGPRGQLRKGRLTLYMSSCRALLDGRELDLTSYEFSLLWTLAEHAGRVLSREQLLGYAKGGAEEVFDRSIDVRISRLRQKLGDDPRRPTLLKTIRGLGYMLVAGDDL